MVKIVFIIKVHKFGMSHYTLQLLLNDFNVYIVFVCMLI